MGFEARERPKVKVGWNLHDSLKEIDEIFNLKDKVQCWKWCTHVVGTRIVCKVRKLYRI